MKDCYAKKQKMARKMAFQKDEAKGIKEYEEAERKAKGKEKETYKEILPDERKHLKKINNIK